MTTTQPAAAPTTSPPAWRGAHRRVGWALLAGWALLLLGMIVAGERESTLADLEADVASGRVVSVALTEGLGPRDRGYAVVEAQWRRGPLRFTTEVVEANPRRAAARSGVDDGTAVIRGDVGARLLALEPDLRISPLSRSSAGSVLGWQVPSSLLAWSLALVIAGFALLVLGPEPRRATRWAWFWILLTAPVGSIAFLVLGGPTSMVSEPRDTSRRLTGGWAFLLTALIGGAAGAT